MRRWILDHPRSVGETYSGHFRTAAAFGLRLVVAGLACLIHALIPGLFQTTASRTVGALHARMLARTKSSDDAGVAGSCVRP
jgi:hypothetical protein